MQVQNKDGKIYEIKGVKWTRELFEEMKKLGGNTVRLLGESRDGTQKYLLIRDLAVIEEDKVA